MPLTLLPIKALMIFFFNKFLAIKTPPPPPTSPYRVYSVLSGCIWSHWSLLNISLLQPSKLSKETQICWPAEHQKNVSNNCWSTMATLPDNVAMSCWCHYPIRWENIVKAFKLKSLFVATYFWLPPRAEFRPTIKSLWTMWPWKGKKEHSLC